MAPTVAAATRTLLRRALHEGSRSTSRAIISFSTTVSSVSSGNSYRKHSSLAIAQHDDQQQNDEEHPKHCQTCTCHVDDAALPVLGDCGRPNENINTNNDTEGSSNSLPPPLPEPAYSVRRRVLPRNLLALDSVEGRRRFLDAMQHETAKMYFPLMQHFSNQSDPAYCGITTLLVVLNALAVDPNVRWKGGWRYYGNENMLLRRCCLSIQRIERVGITMEEFKQLAVCQGINVTMKRPDERNTVEQFRKDIMASLQQRHQQDCNTIIVTSYGRPALNQTGEGHFSPLAAYHADTDSVLLLDVARFKYPPFWVTLTELHAAMQARDSVTGLSRGWYQLSAPARIVESEDRRPASIVPKAEEIPHCPGQEIKVEFCPIK